jgi:type IV secretion system protein VirB10
MIICVRLAKRHCPATKLKAGWEIPAVLEQGLNSDLPGELKALVTVNVYDTATGQFLLIPQGSRLVGKYDSRVSYGQSGVQVVWNRIIFPDASSVDLNGMEGLDAQGNAGLRDKVDLHYKRLFGSAALSSLFTAAFDISQRQNQSVLNYPSPTQTAEASVSRNMSDTGAAITRRNLNVQPTIKVPVGYRFTVRVNRDILFDTPHEPIQADPQTVPQGQQLRQQLGRDSGCLQEASLQLLDALDRLESIDRRFQDRSHRGETVRSCANGVCLRGSRTSRQPDGLNSAI